MRFTVWWGTITHLYPTWHTIVVLDYLSLCTGKKKPEVVMWLQSLGSNLNYLRNPWIVLVKIQYLTKYYYLYDIILYV